MFVYIGYYTGYQLYQYIQYTYNILFGCTRYRYLEQVIAAGIFLYPYFSRYVVDQPVDYIGNSSTIGSIARIGIGKQSRYRIGVRLYLQIVLQVFVQGIVFTYIQYFEPVGYRKAFQQVVYIPTQYLLVG
jgi:hypothetical protein